MQPAPSPTAILRTRAETLAALKAKLNQAGAPAGRLTLGAATLDAALGGGLARASAHEIIAEDPGAADGFCAALLARLQADGPVAWIAAEPLYAPGLLAFGLDLKRLLVIAARREALWALEQCLRAKALAGVVADVTRLDMIQSRRLQLAAEAGGTIGLVLRPATAAREACALQSRLLLDARPSQLMQPRWRVAVARARGGRPGSFDIQWSRHGFTTPARDLVPDSRHRSLAG